MSKPYVILLDKDFDYIEAFSFLFGAYFEYEFHSSQSYTNLKKNLSAHDVNIVLVGPSFESESDQIVSSIEGAMHTSVIRIGESPKCELPKLFDLEILLRIVNTHVQACDPNDKQPSSEHCLIPISLLKKIRNIPAQLYVKINDKMIALTRENSRFTEVEFEKYTTRELTNLYIPREYTPILMNTYIRNLTTLQSWVEVNTIEVAKEITLNTQKIKNIASNFGWGDEVQAITEENLTKALYFVKKHPDFQHTIDYFRKVGEFTQADHSSLSLMVSLNILELTKRNTEINKIILTLTTLLHDISLSDQQIDQKKVLHQELLEKGPNASDDVYAYFRHPENSAGMCRFWRFAPPLTADIILQHQEKPDGTGFPNKITSKNFEKNSAVFIISQDFANFFAENTKNPNYIQFVSDREKIYTAEPFLTQFNAVQTMLKDWMSKYLNSPRMKITS